MILFRKCAAQIKKKDLQAEEQDFGVIEEIFRFDDVMLFSFNKTIHLPFILTNWCAF